MPQADLALFRPPQTFRQAASCPAMTSFQLATKSPPFQRVLQHARKLAHSSLSVLILGETGVGKEVMARYLWSLEENASRPLVILDASTIPPELVASTLFGHAKGAFTGATERHIGCIQAAQGGDLFLDEIANMPLHVQQQLLRALQEHKVRPVGSNQEIDVQFRLTCATNGNLEMLVRRGLFREDLYFRIKRAVLRIPPLRDRKEDIPDLLDLFLRRSGQGSKRLTPDALALSLAYPWPGNIREMQAVMETLAQTTEDEFIAAADLAAQIQPVEASRPPVQDDADSSECSECSPGGTVAFGLDEQQIAGNYKRLQLEFEQTMVRLALRKTGSEKKAAQYLGIPRSTLMSKCRGWGWKVTAEH